MSCIPVSMHNIIWVCICVCVMEFQPCKLFDSIHDPTSPIAIHAAMGRLVSSDQLGPAL